VRVEVVANRGNEPGVQVKVTEAEVTYVNLGKDGKPKTIPR